MHTEEVCVTITFSTTKTIVKTMISTSTTETDVKFSKQEFFGKSKIGKDTSANLISSEKERAMVGRIMYREFFGPGEFRFAIYPDSGWKASWGKAPLLGIVNADDEFLAEKLAYDKGMANPYNHSFGLKIKKIGPNSNSK